MQTGRSRHQCGHSVAIARSQMNQGIPHIYRPKREEASHIPVCDIFITAPHDQAVSHPTIASVSAGSEVNESPTVSRSRFNRNTDWWSDQGLSKKLRKHPSRSVAQIKLHRRASKLPQVDFGPSSSSQSDQPRMEERVEGPGDGSSGG